MAATKRKRRPTRPRQRLDVEARRAQLVALGIEHFGTQAYDDVSVDRIADAARISKGLLYHYFPTKRAFYGACVREAAARLLRVTDLPPRLPPLERLEQSLDAYLGFVRAHAPAFSTLLHGVGIDRDITQIVDRTRAILVGRLTDGFTSFSASILPATPRVHVALRGWIGMAETTSLAWIDAIAEDAKTAPSQRDVRDLLAAALVEIVRRLV